MSLILSVPLKHFGAKVSVSQWQGCGRLDSKPDDSW